MKRMRPVEEVRYLRLIGTEAEHTAAMEYLDSLGVDRKIGPWDVPLATRIEMALKRRAAS